MAINEKGARHISVGGADYRWRATGDAHIIGVSIWPAGEDGPLIWCSFEYGEGREQDGAGQWVSRRQIVVTNRLVRRVIEYAVAERGYDPTVDRAELRLFSVGERIDTADAVRAVLGGRS